MVCGLVLCASAQNNSTPTTQNDGTIVIRKSDLPPELLQQLESKRQLAEVSQKIEAYGKWVGIGKELGVAVNESLSALTIQADKLSKTDVGKFTMFMVAYKVLGNDVWVVLKKTIMVPIGCLIIIVGTWVCIRSLRIQCWGQTVLESTTKERTKQYKFIEPIQGSKDENAFVSIAHGVCYTAFVAIIYGLFF